MLITIANVLNDRELLSVREACNALAWKNGAATAGASAKRVKKNLQASLTENKDSQLNKQLEAAIQTHPVLKATAWPKRFSPLLISRTETGGGYGLHIDNPMMGKGNNRLRTDLSFTLFLSGPDEYEGGELVIERAGATDVIRPLAGDLVLYPTTYLHRVASVTSGSRLVCIGWIESMVRLAVQREVLFDLENLQAELVTQNLTGTETTQILSKTIANLIRLWADT